MNKSELIEMVAQKAGITKKKAEDAVNLIFGSMFDAMVKGKRIEIRGLGSFVVKEYGAYTGRNPRTGESIHVQPKKLPFFKVGKELKERVDELGQGGPASGGTAEDVSGGEGSGGGTPGSW